MTIKRGYYEDALHSQLKGYGWTREYRILPPRRWRVDLALIPHRIAVEIEGGAYRGHGHRSVGKFLRDLEKYNAITAAGWRVFRFTTRHVANGEAAEFLRDFLASGEE